MNGKQKFYASLALVQVILIIVLVSSMNGLVRFVRAQADNFDYYNSPTTSVLAISAAISLKSLLNINRLHSTTNIES